MTDGVLALEHDDVLVVLVDLAVGIRSPQLLDLVGCPLPLLLRIEDVLHYKIIIGGVAVSEGWSLAVGMGCRYIWWCGRDCC